MRTFLYILFLFLPCLQATAQSDEHRIILSTEEKELAEQYAAKLVEVFHKKCRDIIVPEMNETDFKDAARAATELFDNPDDRRIQITSKNSTVPAVRIIYDYLSRLYSLSHGPDRIYERIRMTHYNTHLVGDIYMDPNDHNRYVGTIVSTQDFEGTFRGENRRYYRDSVQRTFFFNVYFYKSAITDSNVLVVKLGDVNAQEI